MKINYSRADTIGPRTSSISATHTISTVMIKEIENYNAIVVQVTNLGKVTFITYKPYFIFYKNLNRQILLSAGV